MLIDLWLTGMACIACMTCMGFTSMFIDLHLRPLLCFRATLWAADWIFASDWLTFGPTPTGLSCKVKRDLESQALKTLSHLFCPENALKSDLAARRPCNDCLNLFGVTKYHFESDLLHTPFGGLGTGLIETQPAIFSTPHLQCKTFWFVPRGIPIFSSRNHVRVWVKKNLRCEPLQGVYLKAIEFIPAGTEVFVSYDRAQDMLYLPHMQFISISKIFSSLFSTFRYHFRGIQWISMSFSAVSFEQQ